MATMSDTDRDAFLLERRIGVLAVGRDGAGPLLAPIWYLYEPGGAFEICMGGSTAKAARLRAEGRASICVQEESRPYRYVTVEGTIELVALGTVEQARPKIETMASRYLGTKAGAQYGAAFATTDEIVVRLTPQRWRTEVLG